MSGVGYSVFAVVGCEVEFAGDYGGSDGVDGGEVGDGWCFFFAAAVYWWCDGASGVVEFGG